MRKAARRIQRREKYPGFSQLEDFSHRHKYPSRHKLRDWSYGRGQIKVYRKRQGEWHRKAIQVIPCITAATVSRETMPRRGGGTRRRRTWVKIARSGLAQLPPFRASHGRMLTNRQAAVR